MGLQTATLLLALSTQAAAPSTQAAPATPAATPTPKPDAKPAAAAPAKIDVGNGIADVAARMLATPRFEDQIEVRDRYQEALNAYLWSSDTSCSTAAPQASPYDEMNRVAGTAPPPSADLLAGLRWLFHKPKGGKAVTADGRYYVYSVSLKANPGHIVNVVRDGPISEGSRSSIPGMDWQLVGRFSDKTSASQAIYRIQRGSAPERGTEPSVLWATNRCPR
jgi:hypothetical protein